MQNSILAQTLTWFVWSLDKYLTFQVGFDIYKMEIKKTKQNNTFS